ncbi:MAG: peptidase S8, partial [Nitrolancea sp.]
TGTVWNGSANVKGQLFDPTFFATGYPITEAYWAKVKVAGTVKDVLVQCFERRCLTYTPSNPTGWQVEMGNIGRHYYLWRYGG